MDKPGQPRSLGEQLRIHTRSLHVEVERSQLIQALLRRQLERAAYCSLMRNLFEIYFALETVLESIRVDGRDDASLLSTVFFPELARANSIAADLDALHGAHWRAELVTQPATRLYVERLRDLGTTREQHSLLLAHVYVRYLGDLNGGQLLEPIVAASIVKEGAGGTAFYDFGGSESSEKLLSAMKHGFANLFLDATRAEAIIAEAVRAFELHRELFQELARAHLAPVQPTLR